MSGGGRTVWWAKDSAWWRRELIVELAEEFGPAGPVVIDWLCCEAKAQNDGGLVKTGYRTISRGCFVELVTVRHAVARAVTLGLLDDFAEDESRFTCRISGWQADQEKGRAAWRKANQREREREPIFERDGWACRSCGATEDLTIDHVVPKVRGGGDHPDNLQTLCGTCNRSKGQRSEPTPRVTGRNGASRPVTVGHSESSTGQDRTEVKEQEEARAGLHPQLPEIISVLTAAPGLEVETFAVNAAAMSRPGDAVAAAHVVASWAHEGGLRHKAANRLLMSAMRNQADEDARRDGVREIAVTRETRRGGAGRRQGSTAADFLAAAEEPA